MKKRPAKVHGILLLDKPEGLTSNAALYEVKSLFEERKVGHTGSLDPIATGMLVCCLGDATRFSSWLLDADKEYRTTLTLGERTDTGDSEGKIIATRPVQLNADQVETAVDTFRGTIEQVPPMYSALKHRGKALYKLARQGIEVERKPRQIQMHSLTVEKFSGPELELKMRCSKGAYVRTLADDLGELLGCGAHVSQLHRLSVGPFKAKGMHSVEQLADMDKKARMGCLLPCDAHLEFMPKLQVTAAAAERLSSGNPVPLRDEIEPGLVRLYTGEDNFFGLAEVTGRMMVQPKKILKLPGVDLQSRADTPTNPPGLVGEKTA